MRKIISLGILVILFSSGLCSEPVITYKKGEISGYIKDSKGVPIEFVSVYLSNTSKGVASNEKGFFKLEAQEGAYTISFRFIGYYPVDKQIEIKAGQRIKLDNIVLRSSSEELNEIVVISSITQKLIKSPIKTEVISTKELGLRPSTLTEMMNLAPGVRIRQSGGLGGASNIMLNGFQGKTIRLFKDGIPLDYLSGSFGLNNVPANSLERVEVYKGVIPADLGADALGGAVNLVTRHTEDKELSLSYEIASFNTHRLTINSRISSKNRIYFVGLDGFYNYSDNNYKVMAPVVHPETANVTPTRLPLFHNAFKQYFINPYVGIANLSWVDELRFDLSGFYTSRENQYAALMEKPLGKAHSKRHSFVVPTLRYRKAVFEKKLQLDQFLAYSSIQSNQTDTLRGQYDWYGKFYAPADANTIGEARATLSKRITENFISRTNINYSFSSNHNSTLNIVFQTLQQKGQDRYGARKNDHDGNSIDLMSLPSNYKKLIVSLGVNSRFWDSRLENISQIKGFLTSSKGRTANLYSGRLNEEPINSKTSSFGYAEALKLKITKNSFIRLSGELTTRLPDQHEMLGDAAYVLPNFNLKPERSFNNNLGYAISKPDNFSFEINGFFRNTKNMIVSETASLIFSRHVNVEQVRGFGVEMDASIFAFSWLRLNGNWTYQNFRLYNLQDKSVQYLEGSRLPNIPFFFANLGMSTKFNKIFTSKDRVEAYWRFSYVHKYFLRYIPKDAEPDGFLGLFGESKVNTKDIIPTQQLHSCGLTWIPTTASKLMLAVEMKNVFDAAIFDNFKIQNAGRSFHIKISYTL